MNRLFIIAFPILFILLLLYVIIFTPAIPIGDLWEMVPLLKSGSTQTILIPMNEHVVFIPKSISFLIAKATRWDLRADNIFCLLMFTVIIFLIYKMFNSQVKDERMRLLFTMALFAQFSPIHHESILWAGQAALMAALMVLISIKYATKTSNDLKSLFASIFALIIASFSFVTGLLGWIVVFIGMLLSKQKKYLYFAIFIIAALLTGFFYALSIHTYSGAISSSRISLKIIDVIVYFFVYMGSNFIPTYKVGQYLNVLLIISGIWGALFLSLGIILIMNTLKFERKTTVIPYMLMLFAVLQALITAVGRHNMGIELAMLSRYHLYQMFYFLGFIWLLIIVMMGSNRLTKLHKPLIFLFVLIIIMNWASGIALGIYKIKWTKPIEEELRSKGEKISLKSARQIYNDPNILKDRIKMLKELKYNVFRDK